VSIGARALLGAVVQELPPALVSDPAKAVLAELTRPLPFVVQSVGFECVLAPDVEAVDLGMSVTTRQAERDSLAGRTSPAEIDCLVSADDAWRRIRAFAERWGHDARFSMTRIPFVYLEFDADGPRRPAPLPSIFVALDWLVEELTPEARRDARKEASVLAPGLPDALEIAETLVGRPLSAEVAEQLTRAFVELPPAALVLHVAVMLGRPRRPVRVSVAVPRIEVVTYLGRVGWPGDVHRLSDTIDSCASACALDHPHARLQLDFDVGEQMTDAVGIGLTPGSGQAWHSLLRRVSDVVSCDDGKLSALAGWPGHVAARIQDRDVALERYLSHLKLAWRRDAVVVKGYFGVVSSGNPGA
jgi:hypothetical protein